MLFFGIKFWKSKSFFRYRMNFFNSKILKSFFVIEPSWKASWWFQPLRKIFVKLIKLDHFPKVRGENKRYWKPSPRKLFRIFQVPKHPVPMIFHLTNWRSQKTHLDPRLEPMLLDVETSRQPCKASGFHQANLRNQKWISQAKREANCLKVKT